MPIPVIDIFAGPGGLGEGFSSKFNEDGQRIFDIKLSIEKDRNAHETLRLRSFYRQFPINKVPAEYYKVLRATSWAERKKLIDSLKNKYEDEWNEAENEAWCYELPYPEEFTKKGKKKGGYKPEEILQRNVLIDKRIEKALNGKKDFLLIGGPPCQAYSLVGRSRNQGISKRDHRVHLYKEYLRIIAQHHPSVFVMENVKGLLSSEVEGVKIFNLIREDLSNPNGVYPEYGCPGYKIYSLTTKAQFDIEGSPEYRRDSDYLIRSENYNIPQRRHRVILLGIRDDISKTPGILSSGDNFVPLDQIIGDLPKIRSGLNRTFLESITIDGKKKRLYKNEEDSNQAWKAIVNQFREEIISWNGFAKDFSKAPIKSPKLGIGSEFIACTTPGSNNPLKKWYNDSNIQGISNHESRAHLTQDLKRYMFSSMFSKTHKRFPRLHEFRKHDEDLLPDHNNAESGKFVDRFRVQLPNEPATTVTSHISKDGHYFIHYDTDQCRSLTVREAARIQTFPDNYLFCGSRTAQFHQVGNAVPPYLAYQIAEIVKNLWYGK